jgi:hypothetical protein
VLATVREKASNYVLVVALATRRQRPELAVQLMEAVQVVRQLRQAAKAKDSSKVCLIFYPPIVLNLTGHFLPPTTYFSGKVERSSSTGPTGTKFDHAVQPKDRISSGRIFVRNCICKSEGN